MWAALVGLLSIAAVRCVVAFAPDIYWHGDPSAQTFAAGARTSFGPTGAAWLSWLAVVVLLLAMIDRMLRRRPVHIVLLTLWAIGAGFAYEHGFRDAGSLRIGGNWIAALALGLAAMHLADRPQIRRFIIAGCVALIIPLGAQAVSQVFYELPLTIKEYEANKQEYLEAQRLVEGSEAHRKFEERLHNPEAFGRFSLSNVFGSVMMGLTLIAAGLAAASWARRQSERQAGQYLGIALAAVGLMAVALTKSTGAMMALAIAAGMVIAACLLARWLKLGASWWRVVGLAVVAMGVIGVLVRGALGPPPTAAGERSILFRAFYWEASLSIWQSQPKAGIGPGRFKDAYLVHKNPLSPEEVADPHNVFVTFIATLGIGGMAWCILLLLWLWQAGASVDRSMRQPVGPRGPPASVPTRWSVAIIVGGIVFITQYVMELSYIGMAGHFAMLLLGVLIVASIELARRGLGLVGVVLLIAALAVLTVALPPAGVWMIGVFGFVAVMALMSAVPAFNASMVGLGLFAATVGLLLHNQIEMALVHAMAMPLVCVILGTGAAPDESESPQSRFARPLLGWLAVAMTVSVAVWMLWAVAIRLTVQQHHLSAAAEQYRQGRPDTALGSLRRAWEVIPDGSVAADTARVWAEAIAARRLPGKPSQQFTQLLSFLGEARQAGLNPTQLWRAETLACYDWAGRTRQDQWLDRAADAAGAMLKCDPYGLENHVLAADVAWRTGRRKQAGLWYRRALNLHEQAYLDPNKQLPGDDLRRVGSRAAVVP